MSGLRLRAVGDMMFGDGHVHIGRGVRALARRHGSGYPFTPPALDPSGDDVLLCGNLECACGPAAASHPRSPFIGDEGALNALAAAGFRVLFLANNHLLEYGPGPADETVTGLEDRGLLPVGYPPAAGAVRSLAWETRQVTFLAYSFVHTAAHDLFPLPPARVLAAVEEAAAGADLVVVSLHWGAEFARRPSPAQIRLGRDLVTAGARVVIGHHPHSVQPVEIYRDGLIAYSLGNHVFDMEWCPRAREGAVLDATIPWERGTVPVATVTPVRANGRHQPVPESAPLTVPEYNRRFGPEGDCDALLATDPEAFASMARRVRREASRDLRRYLWRNWFRLTPPTLSWLLAQRLRRLRGTRRLPPAAIDAPWKLGP
jgi:poly-gamma-glutamate synthesis protein (capsule biosynthesis protein)